MSETIVNINDNTIENNKSQELSNMLEMSKRERDSIKAQMFDAEKRLQELSGIIAALQRTVDLMKKE